MIFRRFFSKKVFQFFTFSFILFNFSFLFATKTSNQRTGIKRYEKEYIQDYIPIEKPLLVENNLEQDDFEIENPNLLDENNVSLLMKAAKAGNDWEVKQLLLSGADVNLKDNQNWTALMYAVRFQENTNVVKLLIDAGAQVDVENSFGNSAFIIAAYYNNNPEILNLLIKYYKSTSKELLKALVLLISSNNTQEHIKLSKLKVFINYSTPINSFYNGKTPLMYAAEYCNSTSVIKVLLENDAIITLRSTEGKTAFDYAKENDNLIHDEVYWSLNKN